MIISLQGYKIVTVSHKKNTGLSQNGAKLVTACHKKQLHAEQLPFLGLYTTLIF